MLLLLTQIFTIRIEHSRVNTYGNFFFWVQKYQHLKVDIEHYSDSQSKASHVSFE